MMQPPPRPQGSEPPHVLRALRALDRRGARLARLTVEAYNRARLEIMARLLEEKDTPLGAVHYHAILAQVEQRLDVLLSDLGLRFGAALEANARIEAGQAVADFRRLMPQMTPAQRALAASFNPVVPHDMVEVAIEGARHRLKAVNTELLGRVRGEVQQAMLQGQSAHEAAREIFRQGVTLDDIRPGVFQSAYHRAQTIARTEMQDAANTVHLRNYQALQEDFPDLTMRWSAAMCSNTCGLCRTLNGTRRRPGQPWVVRSGRKTITCYAPTLHPNCLCRLVVELNAFRKPA